MRKKYVIFLVILFSSKAFFAQANNAEAALYNIGVGSVVSGIGAVINKKPKQKLGKTLLKGMAQGALGGYLVYESKVLLGKITQEKELAYSWPAKIVNSAGISIIENAASNRNFWVQWNLYIGFNRLEFHTNENYKLRYKILPASLFFTVKSAIGRKFEVVRSLKTGEIIFSADLGMSTMGRSYAASMVMDRDHLYDYSTYTHELIHIYQVNDFNFLNTYLNRPVNYLKENLSHFGVMNKIFYWDFNVPAYEKTYNMAGEETWEQYRNNLFEIEARYFSRN